MSRSREVRGGIRYQWNESMEKLGISDELQ
jgi:hypothetical protein